MAGPRIWTLWLGPFAGPRSWAPWLGPVAGHRGRAREYDTHSVTAPSVVRWPPFRLPSLNPWTVLVPLRCCFRPPCALLLPALRPASARPAPCPFLPLTLPCVRL